ncbi:hypothetical protein APS67_003530 [Streptomyces sp. AVP053U2]|nr:hypothetical protein APS67_003530 [Streptomyces sp. AVP053U2]
MFRKDGRTVAGLGTLTEEGARGHVADAAAGGSSGGVAGGPEGHDVGLRQWSVAPPPKPGGTSCAPDRRTTPFSFVPVRAAAVRNGWRASRQVLVPAPVRDPRGCRTGPACGQAPGRTPLRTTSAYQRALAFGMRVPVG